MENYKKKYEDLISSLKKAKEDEMVCDDRFCVVIDNIVPELKESEDERIRKEIISFLENIGIEEIKKIPRDISEWFAWLDKQGEQEPAWSEEDESMFISLKTLLNDASCYSCTEGADKILSWLKSLKPNRWKPSEEQVEYLRQGIELFRRYASYCPVCLLELYEDLKKL